MRSRLAAAVFIIIAAAFYFAGQQKNPPAFFADESSIAYNALTIARSGADEYGVAHPLFFRAFGEYKNPIYIYLLAGVFKVVTPGTVVARRVSAACGFAAALALGWLAFRVTKRQWIALATFATTIMTPNLFEISRLNFEVALYPLILALFLLAAHAAFERERWSGGVIAAIVVTLTLLAYTYSIGRLHAPLLLIAFCAFAWTRERRAAIAIIVASFVVLAIAPMIVFNVTHDGALTSRAELLSYVAGLKHEPLKLAWTFITHYAANFNVVSYALTGDPSARHHVPRSGGSVLVVTIILVLIAIARAQKNRWWWFVIAGTLLALVPVSLTNDRFHSLRMIPFPIFLIVLSIAAWQVMSKRVAIAMIVIGIAQWAFFYTTFVRESPKRGRYFDAGFRQVLDETLAQRGSPIELRYSDYIHGYWFGALRNVPTSAFVALGEREPSPGATVIFWLPPPHVRVISQHGNYTAYVNSPSDESRSAQP